jgi:hypothetical protein
MPDPSRDAALAGFMLVVTALLCAGAGAGIGAALGSPALLGIIGLLAGFGLGIALVYKRFRDI